MHFTLLCDRKHQCPRYSFKGRNYLPQSYPKISTPPIYTCQSPILPGFL